MGESQHRKSSKVFDAASAPLRAQILRLLHYEGPLNYSEIMAQLNLNPSRDAGKFAYHLRKLLRADLIDVNKKTKKYELASLGNTVIDFAKNLENHTSRENRLLVRTSHFSMEEFDRNKIVNALNREAGVPLDLAQKIAEETEERLLKLGTLYLTASLIREFVNSILVEKGLHEYRHSLSRLGIPVDDVTQLIKKAETSSANVDSVSKKKKKNVMTEYVLLNVLPRKVSDAHFAGFLHVNNADSWILKPEEFQHDLRFFFQNGLKSSIINPMFMGLNPPKSFETALTMTSAIIQASKKELAGEQGIKHFNFFLAPFIRDLDENEVRDSLRRFLFNLNLSTFSDNAPNNVSLGIDFSVPRNIESVEAIGVNGKKSGCYGDYSDEASTVLRILLDLMIEINARHPLFSPYLINNITLRDLKSKDLEQLLLKSHELAVKFGTPYFVNSLLDWQKSPAYFASGSRLDSNWTKDWELDTIRTGSLGNIVINFPRLAYEARGNDNKLLEGLNDHIEMIFEALKIKYNSIKERIKWTLLPFLSQPIAGEHYFRIRNAPLTISLIGLNEAVTIHTGNQLHENNKTLNFALKIMGHIRSITKKFSRKSDFRITLSHEVGNEASHRLAMLDIERYGWGIVFAQGTRDAPYYTDLTAMPLEVNSSLKKRLKIEGAFHSLLNGGHLSLIELKESEDNPERLFKMTKHIIHSYKIGAYAFTKSYSYCANCQRIFSKLMRKCPACKSVRAFTPFSRLSSKYVPLERWPLSKKEVVNKRVHYIST
jgi:ribonucleoside-triphosphate reductase